MGEILSCALAASSDSRRSEQPREIPEHSPSVGICGKTQHQAAHGVDYIDVSGRIARRGQFTEESSVRHARYVQALVLAQQRRRRDSAIAQEPYPLDPFRVLAERQT